MTMRVKGIYAKPWSKMVQESIPLTQKTIARLGQAIVDAVVLEAKKDLAKQQIRTDGPEGIPDTKKFFNSFGYRVSGKSTIEITCTWPYINQLLEGRKPFSMTWLTQDQGVDVVPMKQGGVVVFRTTPENAANAWVHPGFARHSFVQRGIKKGREKMMEIITQEASAYLLKGDIFR